MSEQQSSMIIHLVAGGVAGTIGAILTCPLEVVKTRLQANQCSHSSSNGVYSKNLLNNHNNIYNATNNKSSTSQQKLTNNSKLTTRLNCYSNILLRNNHLSHSTASTVNIFNFDSQLNHNHKHNFESVSKNMFNRPVRFSLYMQFKMIIKNEGVRALFKGLVPNVVGVAPYRAIYFFSYANSKNLLSPHLGAERPIMHITSAFLAGFTAVTITNPIWFVKTRLQLDESRRGMSTYEVVQKILREKGPLGFYKGITASYFGICESAMYFVIYERLKQLSRNDTTQSLSVFSYFTSAGFAKTLASCLCYPHEVARTRLRQEGDKYKTFFQTLQLIVKEEGARGMYKGMATHLIRQIPNTAIVMTSYELIVKYFEVREKELSFSAEDE